MIDHWCEGLSDEFAAARFPKDDLWEWGHEGPTGENRVCSIPFPPGQGHCTDRQGLALVFTCHVLDPHGQVPHRALATAEIEAVWVHEEQVSGKGGIGGVEDPLEGWGQSQERRTDMKHVHVKQGRL